ncbi:alpha/beta hydrolase family protein [Bifidobacterium scaligerum]|uniref:Alpha/beta hydrolase n=1 Tax=Bifidobacterium scaligerum TaxID=2052656 RepID=A0A2M9HRH2_9BIFI|nr:alpha/beta hydrolase [Bifidobacterium scaligerum]PJM79411.1 alpha/beta hydrolase [Bifidobacterium scaligerum]
MKRIARIIAIALALLLVFATLGWAMMPRWDIRPYTDHLTVATSDPDIEPANVSIPHEGRYQTRETNITVNMGGGVQLPAVLREPVNASGLRPACLFIHGSGTSGAEDFGDIANAMASAGIVTLVPAKRNDDYTVLHRDYARFANEYSRAMDVLRGTAGVNPNAIGLYAESEGTWIATILAASRKDIAFAALTSAPVFKGREQMAMAVSAYAKEAGAPRAVIKDMAKLMSLDYAPFDLAYADFDADRYLSTLTMPVLVSYGTYDTAMPIEQGAQRIMAAAHRVGNGDVTVRYYAANHQMRAGQGLFTPNLPLADGYTQALENWINGVVAERGNGSADAEDAVSHTSVDAASWNAAGVWTTPQIAGVQPHQRFAAPERTDSGIIGSLGVLVGIMAAGPVLLAVAMVLGLGVAVTSLSRRRSLRVRIKGKRAALHVRPLMYSVAGPFASGPSGPAAVSEAPTSQSDTASGLSSATPSPGIAGPCWSLGIVSATTTMLVYGYLTVVGLASVYMQPFPRLFGVCWAVLQVLTVLLVLTYAVQLEYWWRSRRCLTGARHAICGIMAIAAFTSLTSMAFWGLFTLPVQF